MPPVYYSIELPNQSRVRELGYEEHARRCLQHAQAVLGKAQSARALPALDPTTTPSSSTFSKPGTSPCLNRLPLIRPHSSTPWWSAPALRWPRSKISAKSNSTQLAQAIGWYASNETTFTRLAQMGVDESGIGDRAGRPGKRFKIHGVLRDALRQKSTGVVEVDEERGLVKYAKPAGVIASLIPMTNPALTPPVTGVYAAKARNAVIFSPHPAHQEHDRGDGGRDAAACVEAGAPADLFQCVTEPSIPLTQALMARCDLTLATGGKPMVKAAYSSGRPAYGVGAGNSTMVIDETADIELRRETRACPRRQTLGPVARRMAISSFRHRSMRRWSRRCRLRAATSVRTRKRRGRSGHVG